MATVWLMPCCPIDLAGVLLTLLNKHCTANVTQSPLAVISATR